MSKKTPKKKREPKPRERKRLPKQATLPDDSFKQVRSKPLDDVCHTLTELRDTDAKSRLERGAAHSTALKVMIAKNIYSYTANGSTVTRTPGQDKIQSREAKGEPETVDEADEATGTE